MSVEAYYLPQSIEETTNILDDPGKDLLVIAGGTLAMPLINEGISTPQEVVGLKSAGLNYLDKVDGEYIVGAYLKLKLDCDFVDYNVRPPGGGLEGLLPEGVVIEGGKPISEQSPECMSAMLAMTSIQDQLQDPEFLMSHMYSNQAVESMIERESGKTVTTMFRVTEGGRDIIIAVTEDMFSCIATLTEFCLCAGAGS